MEKFAFIFHPISIKDMEHVSPIMKYIPDRLIEAGLKMKRPFKVSNITGVYSEHAEAEGWFVGIPLTAKQMVELPEEFVMLITWISCTDHVADHTLFTCLTMH